MKWALVLAAAFLSWLASGAHLQRIPWAIPAACAVLSLASYICYARDKAKARRGEWRTPESTLHLLDLLGGWPGGWIAQRQFRHKTRKLSFQIIFWLSVVLQVTGWIWIFLKVPAEPRLFPFLGLVGQSFLDLLR